MLCHIHLLQM